jgi:hypothetical protein
VGVGAAVRTADRRDVIGNHRSEMGAGLHLA